MKNRIQPTKSGVTQIDLPFRVKVRFTRTNAKPKAISEIPFLIFIVSTSFPFQFRCSFLHHLIGGLDESSRVIVLEGIAEAAGRQTLVGTVAMAGGQPDTLPTLGIGDGACGIQIFRQVVRAVENSTLTDTRT